MKSATVTKPWLILFYLSCTGSILFPLLMIFAGVVLVAVGVGAMFKAKPEEEPLLEEPLIGAEAGAHHDVETEL